MEENGAERKVFHDPDNVCLQKKLGLALGLGLEVNPSAGHTIKKLRLTPSTASS